MPAARVDCLGASRNFLEKFCSIKDKITTSGLHHVVNPVSVEVSYLVSHNDFFFSFIIIFYYLQGIVSC